MKTLFRIFSFILTLAFIISVAVFAVNAVSDNGDSLYLVSGLDEAGNNLDVIFLVSVKGSDGTAAVIQIPRDTYIRFGDSGVKINSLYSRYLLRGFSDGDAMEKASEYIAKSLGVTLDGFFLISSKGFRDTVDAIGGVEVSLPSDFTYTTDDGEKTLYKGENLLDGKAASAFVRYRKGYLNGDLGRIDAQKIFINGVYETVKGLGIKELLSAFSVMKNEVVTSLTFTSLVPMALSGIGDLDDTDIRYITLPGAALFFDGVSYYSVNKKASAELLAKYVSSFDGTFDRESHLLGNGEEFYKIYHSESFVSEEYNFENIDGLEIPMK